MTVQEALFGKFKRESNCRYRSLVDTEVLGSIRGHDAEERWNVANDVPLEVHDLDIDGVSDGSHGTASEADHGGNEMRSRQRESIHEHSIGVRVLSSRRESRRRRGESCRGRRNCRVGRLTLIVILERSSETPRTQVGEL